MLFKNEAGLLVHYKFRFDPDGTGLQKIFEPRFMEKLRIERKDAI